MKEGMAIRPLWHIYRARYPHPCFFPSGIRPATLYLFPSLYCHTEQRFRETSSKVTTNPQLVLAVHRVIGLGCSEPHFVLASTRNYAP